MRGPPAKVWGIFLSLSVVRHRPEEVYFRRRIVTLPVPFRPAKGIKQHLDEEPSGSLKESIGQLKKILLPQDATYLAVTM